MTHYVMQYGNHFFVLMKIQGYDKYPFMHGTKITAEEYKKLFYSGTREKMDSLIPTCTRHRIKGNVNELLEHEVFTCNVKEEMK